MLDHGNGQLSAVGFFNPTMGEAPAGEFFGGAPAGDAPLPYEVRWCQAENGGVGAWVIWLPSTSLLVSTGPGTWATIAQGITAAQSLPSGWYVCEAIPPASSTPSCWLVVEKNESTGVFSAKIDEMAGQSQTGVKTWSFKIAAMTSNSTTGERSVEQLVDSVVTLSGEGGENLEPDDVSTELIPDPAAGTQPAGDEGRLQIKGFKSGSPFDQNSLADYLAGNTSLPSGGILLLARGTDSDGAHLFYLPLGALWGDGSSGGLPAPEVTYLDDVTWDQSNHQLVKQWVTKNLVTGVKTPVQGAPQGKTPTIDTTAISTIIN